MALQLLASEQLTVSTSAVGITSTLFDGSVSGEQLNVLMAHFAYDSGGKIYHSSNIASGSLSNAGGGGEHPQSNPDKWEIWGLEDLKDWLAIKDSGASDAVLQINLYGKE